MARNYASRRSAVRVARGALVVGAVTALCYWTRLNTASVALIYLIAVVLQSLDCTFPEAAIVSVMATAALDYFFTDPVMSFGVSGPLEGVTLVCLLIVTLIITQLQSRSRAEAYESKLQRAIMESVYKVSQELLALTPPAVDVTALLEPFLSAFGVAAVCLFDAATLEAYTAGSGGNELETKTRECFIAGESAAYPELGIVVETLRARDKICGAIGFEGLRNASVTAPPLATLAVAALERARVFRAATTAAVQAETETMRSALLDALAHEFKTPLATILTAAGGLRIGGSTAPELTELAEMIETEASRLGDLTTRLLRLARVDREDLKPRLQSTELAELTRKGERRYAKLWPDRRIVFRNGHEVVDVHIDPELIGLAFSQLVENACRYSWPDTNVRIELGRSEGMGTITVWNSGPAIEPADRERIFERFYRGSEARLGAPGTGLGLYVARKIARAHGGDVVLLDTRNDEIGFRLSVPLSNAEVTDANRED
jgi:two-component system sensor histidine kinase KdpD